jgi:1,2-diacylglycerol 3-beta-galactosyltransferase
VITDLTRLHRSWFHEGVDMTLVPTEEAFGEALSYNIPKEKIVVSGVPVRPGFQLDTRSKQKLRMELGWNTSMTTALVVGSKRVKNMENILHALNHSGWPIQWVLVAGKDEKLASWFRAQEWHNPVFIYDYIDQMHQFMGAADFVITKAGGLVVSESLASGLPMLIVDVTPGQEEGNVEYVISHQAGDLAPTPLQAVETLAHWMKHGQAVLLRRSHAARLAGRANSAFVVAELALTMIAQQSAQQKTMKISRQRSMPPRLKLLLENLGIRPEIKQPGKITPHGEK